MRVWELEAVIMDRIWNRDPQASRVSAKCSTSWLPSGHCLHHGDVDDGQPKRQGLAKRERNGKALPVLPTLTREQHGARLMRDAG